VWNETLFNLQGSGVIRMDILNELVGVVNGFAWGGFSIILLVGTGLVLTLGTKFVQFRKLGFAFKLLFSKDVHGDGDVTPFQALMTSLSATVGTGNIAGVATAIVAGGPGAVFWMWVTAAVGGATKFGEALLAVKYRVTNEDGEMSGGPMYYIKNGMKEQYGINFAWLGWLFAFFGVFASFGIGNMTQANSVAASLQETTGMDPMISGLILMVFAGLVIIGGIKNIARVTEKLVPVMCLVYIFGALTILVLNADLIVDALSLIFKYAFNAEAVGGGLVGTVIRYGVARGVFSNEAGLGSAPIAHAASKTDDPVKQGIIGSLGSFIDTIIVCSMTALVILVSGLIKIDPATGLMVVEGGVTGAQLTTIAFSNSLPGFGQYIVTFGLIFFAFSTILGWYYYGSKCFEYIAGVKAVDYYKYLFIVVIFFGGVFKLEQVWNLSDTFNGLMALPNLIGLLALAPVIFKMLKSYENKASEKK